MLVGGILLVTAVAFGVLVLLVAPAQYAVGTQVFGVGLGVTAYTLGMRHAFDPDHIAAIDNTTRKLLGDGKRASSVGFWFALGHSSVVILLTALVAAGARVASTVTSDRSSLHRLLGAVSVSVSGLFLYVIGVLNLVALIALVRLYRAALRGRHDQAEVAEVLARRGLVARLLRGLTRAIRHPAQMFPVGLLFGVGFDTATEVTLLVIAGTGAATGLPWWSILTLPLLFTCGMTLFDTLDGLFMTAAYSWASNNPLRSIFYNIATTTLSVAVAVVIGSVELMSVLHDRMHMHDPVTTWVSGLDLDNIGYVIVGLFLVTGAMAIGYWKMRPRDRTTWVSDHQGR